MAVRALMAAKLHALLLFVFAACHTPPPPTDPPQEPRTETRVVALQHATTDEIVPHLMDIFSDISCTRRGPAVRSLPPGFSIAAHPATNSLLLQGSPRDLDEAVEVIARLDEPATPQKR